MRTDPLPHEIRRFVALTFRELDEEFAGPWDVDGTILIDDGRCAGEPTGRAVTWPCG